MVKSMFSAAVLLAGVLLAIPAGLSISCDFPPKGLLEQPRVEFRGLYVNEVYSYTVVIPDQLTGYSQTLRSMVSASY